MFSLTAAAAAGAPLSAEVAQVRAAAVGKQAAGGGDGGGDGGDGAADPLVMAVLASVPEPAVTKGVPTSSALADRLGRAVRVDPIKPTMKALGTKRLQLISDDTLSNFAFKFDLRRYS